MCHMVCEHINRQGTVVVQSVQFLLCARKMSDVYPRYGLLWQQCRSKLDTIIQRRLPQLQRIDLKLLQPLIQARSLLATGEADQVWDSRGHSHERSKRLIQFVCQKCGRHYRNGLHGLEVFVECLRESGSCDHLELAQNLTEDLREENLLPEEFLNQRQYEHWRTLEYSKLLVSIKDKFRELLPGTSRQFRVFQTFLLSYVSDPEQRGTLLSTTTSCEIFDKLSVWRYISENNRGLLHTLLHAFGGGAVSSDRQSLAQLDLQIDFVDLALELADMVPERSTIDQLKLCLMSSPVEFGRYYKRLENETDVRTTLIKVVQDYQHPRLLHRVARHFHPGSLERLEGIMEAREVEVQQSRNKKRYIDLLERYISVLMDINRHLMANPNKAADFLRCFPSITLSRNQSSLKLTTHSPSSPCSALLSLVPFISYHNPTLLEYIANNFSDHTLISHFLDEAKTFTSQTAISEIYDVQLDSLPLELTERGIVILTLHVAGPQWTQPRIKTAADLAQDTAENFNLNPWSVVYYKTVFCESEPGRKGDCKVEMLLPALAACIILRDGQERLKKWENHSIVYLEVLVENECYISNNASSVGHMYQRAQEEKFFAPYFQDLNNAVSVPQSS